MILDEGAYRRHLAGRSREKHLPSRKQIISTGGERFRYIALNILRALKGHQVLESFNAPMDDPPLLIQRSPEHHAALLKHLTGQEDEGAA